MAKMGESVLENLRRGDSVLGRKPGVGGFSPASGQTQVLFCSSLYLRLLTYHDVHPIILLPARNILSFCLSKHWQLVENVHSSRPWRCP